MITSFVSSAARLSLAPARLAGRMAGSLLREVRGNGAAAAPAEPAPERARPATRTRARAQAKRKPRSRPLDDVTIARKVESSIFRGIDADKGKIDVNVAGGVVWLRGEARTPELITELEARAAGVAEVRGVENLLHLPKTPAPSRTDTPAPQRKTRRSPTHPEERAVTPGEISEEAPAPPSAEPAPKEVAAAGKGRGPAPVGSPGGADDPAAAERDEPAERDDPDVAELDKDPAYQPSEPGLRDLKGG